jgi:hypothetical protein
MSLNVDFGQFFSRDLLPALAWLGRREWMEHYADSNYEVAISSRPDAARPSPEDKKKYPPELWGKVNECLTMASNDRIRAMWLLSLSKLLGFGPKMFIPTVEDCHSSLDIRVGLRFEEYRQPYNAVLIEIPQEFQEHLKKEYRIPEGPKYVIPFHDMDRDFVTVSTFFSTENIIVNFVPNRPEYETIEDCLTTNQGRANYPTDTISDREMQVALLVQRLAMNFCLLMTLKGIRQGGPASPALASQIDKLRRSNKNQDHRLAEALKIGAVNLVKLHQDIKISAEVIEGREGQVLTDSEVAEGRASGRLVPAHWVSGHHKMQPYGPRNSLRKRIYIQRYRVNKWIDALPGAPDLSEGSVVYRLSNKRGTNGQDKAAS